MGDRVRGLELADDVAVVAVVSATLRRGSGDDSVDCGLLPEDVRREVSASCCTAFRISWLMLMSLSP